MNRQKWILSITFVLGLFSQPLMVGYRHAVMGWNKRALCNELKELGHRIVFEGDADAYRRYVQYCVVESIKKADRQYYSVIMKNRYGQSIALDLGITSGIFADKDSIN